MTTRIKSNRTKIAELEVSQSLRPFIIASYFNPRYSNAQS